MNSQIRVFVVDDHALFREGLVRMLAAHESLAVVGSADSAESAIAAVPAADADVVLLDYDLGEHTAQHVVRGLSSRGFRGRSLVVTAGLPAAEAIDLIRLGVSGIFHKQRPLDELHHDIHQVAAGRVVIDHRYLQSLAAEVAAPGGIPPLTDRDRRVLQLLLDGHSNKDIALAIGISESAVKSALQQLFAKTGVRTRAQLVRVALERLRPQL